MDKKCYVRFFVIFVQIIMYFQMYCIIKNKSAWDVSYIGFVSGFIFAFGGLIYGLLKKEKQLFVLGAILSFSSFLVVVAIHIYQ